MTSLFTAERALTISSPAIPLLAGRPALVPLKLSGREGVNSLFEYQLILQTPDEVAALGGALQGGDFVLANMLGRELCCRIELEGAGSFLTGLPGGAAVHRGSGVREISGLITAARMLGSDSRHALYELTLRPWLHLASLSADCKVFQNQTPVEVIRAVLADYPFAADFRLIEDYPTRDYTVQYNETDLQFIERLLQEWGMNFHFEHSAGVHRLIVSDHNGAFTPLQPGVKDSAYLRLAYHPPGHKIDEEYIHDFVPTERLTAGSYESREHDYTRPKLSLTARSNAPRQTGQSEQDVYLWRSAQTIGVEGNEEAVQLAASDWSQPNAGSDRQANRSEPQGAHLARLRMQALRQGGQRARGAAHCRGIAAGHTFSLSKHPQQAANTEYLTLATHTVVENVSEDTDRNTPVLRALSDSQRLTGQWRCEVEFEVQPTTELLRPPAHRAKPTIPGPETALVCGPEGSTAESNIFTDTLGRIKVQFFWDRYGARNHTSSCWVRVASEWAGNQLGAMHLPRVGQEVIVSFIGGDIDRPICTGRVYHQDSLPPWRLPEQQALSGIRSRELKPGAGNSAAGRSNHLLLDDSEGQIQAQLKSDHQHSSLSLGHITRVEDHQGRKDNRGEGFELRSDGHGAIRAKDGLLITTEPRPSAQSHTTDMGETTARLNQAQGQHEQLGDLAQQHQAQDAKDQGQVAQGLSQQNQGIEGKAASQGQFPELKAPHLVLASPAGIASTTPGSTHQHSGEHHAITSEGHTSVSSAKSLLASAEQAIRLFAYKAGIRIVSAVADVEVKALEQHIHLLAKLKITQTANRIEIRATEEVLVNGGGSYTRWNASGIESGTSGSWTSQAASHSMTGAKHLPLEAGQGGTLFDEAFVLRNQHDGKPLGLRPYRIKRADGQYVYGVTDKDGTTRLSLSEAAQALDIEITD